MPDKTLKVVTYAAGASLAAITLIYVFGPTYLLDNDASRSNNGAFSSRRNGGVGLSNPANDCFINSVLQALAGLGDLRSYLIQELHRRNLDGESVYAHPVPAGALVEDSAGQDQSRLGKDIPGWKLEGLQQGIVTRSLKDILDALNERPIYKKTISAAPFVRALEEAFKQRISRQQQDAQEFLQVVAERLCDEYHAGRRARLFASRIVAADDQARDKAIEQHLPCSVGDGGIAAQDGRTAEPARNCGEGDGGGQWRHGAEEDGGFPLEGKFESQIECQTCGFRPRPTSSTFCTLTLNVPRVSSTTLGACFDGMFKTEYIDDFKCEKCRLLHALSLLQSEIQRSSSDAERAKVEAAAEQLQLAIDKDPENPPKDIALPDSRHAPKRRIARHIRMTEFPNVLAIHLSRSIFDASYSSQKNLAKVAFPEELPLGGLLQQRRYRLLGVVTHKGSHNSGHYESFRRQNVYPPFSNPSTFQASGVYSKRASPVATPRLSGESPSRATIPASTLTAPDLLNLGPGSHSAARSGSSLSGTTREGGGAGDSPSSALSTAPNSADSGLEGQRSNEASSRPGSAGAPPSTPHVAVPEVKADTSNRPPSTRSLTALKSKERKQQARWWRISDDKVKEASTRDVLSMQREVYLLFYELERPRAT